MKRKFLGVLLFCYAAELIAQQPPPAAAQQGDKVELGKTPFKLDCMHLESLKKGRPVFVGPNDGVRIGIATQNDVVNDGEPVMVDTWVDNRTEKPIMVGGRCLPYPKGVDVFDESGHRLISFHEQAELDAGKKGITTVEVCASTGILFEIPAHTCRAPAEIDGRNWVLDYKLTPGRYYLFPRTGIDPALYKQGLLITVQ